MSNSKYRIDRSCVQGRGIIANQAFESNEVIDACIKHRWRFIPVVTSHFGSLINHSYNPSATVVYNRKTNEYDVVAKRPISVNEEITVNYNQCPWFVTPAMPWYK